MTARGQGRCRNAGRGERGEPLPLAAATCSRVSQRHRSRQRVPSPAASGDQSRLQGQGPQAGKPAGMAGAEPPGPPDEHRASSQADEAMADQRPLELGQGRRGQGLPLQRSTQQGGKQQSRGGTALRRGDTGPPSLQQQRQQGPGISRSGQAEMNGPPTGDAKETDHRRAGHDGEANAPCQCHHALQRPCSSAWRLLPCPSHPSAPPGSTG